MPSAKTFVLNLWVATAYFAGGFIGELVKIEPSNSSPIWPAAGIALAAMLIGGWRVLPGLFAGIFITQVYVSVDGGIPEALVSFLFITTVKAIASFAQAVLGMLLVQRYLGRNEALLDFSKILLFFFYGGVISCLIAPTICIGLFYQLNIITANDFFFSWFTWWVGDVIGVVIFTPIIFSFFAEPQSIWFSRRATVALPLCLLMVLLVMIFFYSKKQESERISTLFNHRVERVQNILQDEITAHANIAENIRDALYADEEVTKEEFYLLTRSHLRHHPDLIAIEWIPRILKDPKAPESDLNKVTFPIKYLEPLQGNEKALGFDITQNKTALKTLNKIIKTGNTLSTGLIRLVQDSDHSRVTSIIYSPLYQRNIPTAAIKNKADYLLGVVAVVFTIEEGKTHALSALVDYQLQIEIQNDGEVFYTNFIDDYIKPISFVTLSAKRTINAKGSSWQVLFKPSEQFLASQTTWHIWWVIVGGLVLTSFVGLGLLVLTGRTAHIKQQVEFKTRDLSKINNILNQQVLLTQKLEAEQLSRNVILEALAKGKDFKKILTDIVKNVEKLNPEMICSILLIDEKGKHLTTGAAIKLPDFYIEAIDGVAIGNGVGSCGTAAFTKKRVIVEDIMTHPFWAPFKQLAKDAGLYACWSEPILSSRNKVLGTFAIYYQSPRTPNNENLAFIKRVADLTAIAIERKQAEDELKIAAITFQSHDAVVITDIEGTILRINQAYSNITGYSAEEVLGKNASVLNSGMHDSAFFSALYAELAETGQWEGEIWNRRKNGECFPERITITAVYDEAKITHYIGIFSDISDKKDKEGKNKTACFL